jgi:uncharacterized caspase-like protein
MTLPCVARPPGWAFSAKAALLLALAAIGSMPTSAPAQVPPGGGPPPIDQQIVNPRPKFFVRARVDRKYQIYAEGETLTLKVRCEEDAFLYILYQQADGKIFQIFPNRGQPDNKIKAMQDIQVPAPDDAFRWVVDAPLGKEVVKVIASKKPIDALSLPGLREDHFNPITQDQVAGAGQQIGKEPANVWSEHDIKIMTVGRGQPTTPPEATKRVGVFFGVAEYEFDAPDYQFQRDEMMEKNGKVDESKLRHMNLNYTAKDATDLAQKFKEVGQLSDSRVFVNREVTKDKLREMITEWLPSVSKPGDTVFIFFSGHGDQIPDDDGDEKDGMDETIDTTEMMSLFAALQLLKEQEKGQVPASLVERVRALLKAGFEVYNRILTQLGGENAPGAKEAATKQLLGAIMRPTVVTDDEMGHWIQKLDGRRIVVIMDSCHSGGMNRTEGAPTKDLEPRRRRFDFLSGEFARLKDLDQPSLTVLGAASEDQASAELPGDRNGVFTATILKVMSTSAGPVDARQTFEYAKTAIIERYRIRNEARAQHNREHPGAKPLEMDTPFSPSFFTTDPKPIYLKPPAADSNTDPAQNED